MTKDFLIVRLGAMGDVLHAISAVTVLRLAVPGAKISWVIDPRWQPLLATPGAIAGTETMPLVDSIHLADTRVWSRRPVSIATLRSIRSLRRELRDVQYDAVLDLQGSIRSAVISRFARGRVFGSAMPRETPAALFYSKRVPITAPHVIEQAAEICSAAVGSRLTPQTAAQTALLPRDAAAEIWCEEFLSSASIDHTRFAVITPGAGWGAKRWPAERYGEVAAGLAELGVATLVNCGPGESQLAAAVVAASRGQAHAVECTLPQLIALLRRAAIFLGGDTGPLHLAAALRVPVVGLYGPTDPVRNGPYATAAIVLRHGSSQRDHTRNDATEAGLLAIPAAAALDAAHTLLQQSKGEVRMTILKNFEAYP
jgi:heptosyltransferase-1